MGEMLRAEAIGPVPVGLDFFLSSKMLSWMLPCRLPLGIGKGDVMPVRLSSFSFWSLFSFRVLSLDLILVKFIGEFMRSSSSILKETITHISYLIVIH